MDRNRKLLFGLFWGASVVAAVRMWTPIAGPRE